MQNSCILRLLRWVYVESSVAVCQSTRDLRWGWKPMRNLNVKMQHSLFQTLLDLSASPNYKDTRGLTPLYHCILHDTTALCTEILLHDHAVVGVADERGWQEIHQVTFLKICNTFLKACISQKPYYAWMLKKLLLFLDIACWLSSLTWLLNIEFLAGC